MPRGWVLARSSRVPWSPDTAPRSVGRHPDAAGHQALQVGPRGEQACGLLGEVVEQATVGVPSPDSRHPDHHVDPCVDGPAVDDRGIRPAIGGQPCEGGMDPRRHVLEVEIVGQGVQRRAFEDHSGRSRDIDDDGRGLVLTSRPGQITAERGHRSSLGVPHLQGIDAAEGEQALVAGFIDHRHDCHVTVLVAARLVELIEDGDHTRQQSIVAKGSRRGDAGNDTGRDLLQEGAHLRIGPAVVVREGRLRQRSPCAATITVIVQIAAHGMTLSDENGPMLGARPHSTTLTLATLAGVAVNLRVALTSVPTVESEIQQATGWSNAAVGALTTIPILCMGAFALTVPWVARLVGRRATVAGALALLTIAMGVRLLGSLAPVLTTSVFLAGIGIALAMGIVPILVRAQVSDRMGIATGIWTGAMMLGAAAGGSLTAPLAILLGSWQGALAIWALPAALGLILWLRTEGLHDDPGDPRPASVHVRTLPWRSRTAWAMTLFVTFNSLAFYTSVAWLAPSFVDRGWTQDRAGLLFGLFTIGQLIGAVMMPIVAERTKARRALFAGLVVTGSLSVLALAMLTSTAALLLASIFGFTIGAAFTMALALLSEFARDGHASGRLSAMVFFVTYMIAATGPILAGALIDAGATWFMVFGLVALVALGQLIPVPALRRGSVVD